MSLKGQILKSLNIYFQGYSGALVFCSDHMSISSSFFFLHCQMTYGRHVFRPDHMSFSRNSFFPCLQKTYGTHVFRPVHMSFWKKVFLIAPKRHMAAPFFALTIGLLTPLLVGGPWSRGIWPLGPGPAAPPRSG